MKEEEKEIFSNIINELSLSTKENMDNLGVLDIVTIGDKILRDKNVDIENIDKIHELVVNMVATLYFNNGCGLAGPQVGKNINLFIAKVAGIDENDEVFVDMPLTVFINPKIVKYSEEKQWDYEGCLSIPDFDAKVERSSKVVIEYTDLFGKRCVKEYTDFLARVVQHEYDHLQGRIYTDIADMKTFTTRDNLIKNNEEV